MPGLVAASPRESQSEAFPSEEELVQASDSEDLDGDVDPNYKKQAKTIEAVDLQEVYRKLPLIPLVEADTKFELKCDNKHFYNKSELDLQRRLTDGWGTRQDVGKRKERTKIIAQILQRWWFVFPMWPPKEFDWESELRRRSMRLVDAADWEKEPNEDDGYSKVWGLKMYPGLFRDIEGKLVDLRPKQTCPCFGVLNQRPLEDLINYLERAYENQIRVLKEHPTYESDKRIRIISDELSMLRKRKTELLRKAKSQQAQNAFTQAKATMRKM